MAGDQVSGIWNRILDAGGRRSSDSARSFPKRERMTWTLRGMGKEECSSLKIGITAVHVMEKET
jgi:hypothetical protein